jgi:hypothetical protein
MVQINGHKQARCGCPLQAARYGDCTHFLIRLEHGAIYCIWKEAYDDTS